MLLLTTRLDLLGNHVTYMELQYSRLRCRTDSLSLFAHYLFSEFVSIYTTLYVIKCWLWLFLRSCDRASWKIFIIKSTRCTDFSNLFWNKIYMFRRVPVSIIRSFSLHTLQWYMSYSFADNFRAGSGWNCSSILILLASCLQTCMTYTIAVCAVKNSL
jgi:hypothetical protein